jgi:hypothetical protein
LLNAGPVFDSITRVNADHCTLFQTAHDVGLRVPAVADFHVN